MLIQTWRRGVALPVAGLVCEAGACGVSGIGISVYHGVQFCFGFTSRLECIHTFWCLQRCEHPVSDSNILSLSLSRGSKNQCNILNVQISSECPVCTFQEVFRKNISVNKILLIFTFCWHLLCIPPPVFSLLLQCLVWKI